MDLRRRIPKTRGLAKIGGTAFLVALTMALAGCGGGPGQREEAGAVKPTAEYLPLAVGNSWTTRITGYLGGLAGLGLPETGAERASALQFILHPSSVLPAAHPAALCGRLPPVPSRGLWSIAY